MHLRYCRQWGKIVTALSNWRIFYQCMTSTQHQPNSEETDLIQGLNFAAKFKII